MLLVSTQHDVKIVDADHSDNSSTQPYIVVTEVR